MISLKKILLNILKAQNSDWGFYRWPDAAANCPQFAEIKITTIGRPVFVSTSGDMNPSSAGAWMVAKISRDGINLTSQCIENNGASYNEAFFLQYLDTPSAGEHTYRVDFTMGSGAGNLCEEVNTQHQPHFIVFQI